VRQQQEVQHSDQHSSLQLTTTPTELRGRFDLVGCGKSDSNRRSFNLLAAGALRNRILEHWGVAIFFSEEFRSKAQCPNNRTTAREHATPNRELWVAQCCRFGLRT
jgi:hypothetical protein